MEVLLIVGSIAWAIWFFGTKASNGQGSGASAPLDPPTPRNTAPDDRIIASVIKQSSIPAPAVVKQGSRPFTFCALDTETTGIVPRSRRHRAFEISCVKFTPAGERSWSQKRFTRYVKVDTRELKGLKLSPMWGNHSLAGGQREAVEAFAALSELRDFVQDLPLVCHNAAFDKCVIENEIEKVAHRWKPANKWICTLLMARSSRTGVFVGYSPGRDDGMSYKLEHVANALKLSLDPNRLHLGHYDAEVAGTVFLNLHHTKSVKMSQIP